ncbi:MAG: hypothetical protein CMB80_27035 [Flammeovirgaceae bacterium]|nr:hypothetical protein [Flammeovirgaceae bacterium]|tara:strand:- start:1090 stop:1851 length:762 start_codon:yes stop_codon:yes gene_type:complete
MFFVLSKLLVFLLNPVVWIVTLLLFGLITSVPVRRKIGLYGGFSLLFIATNPLITNLAMSKLEWTPKTKDEIPLVHTGIVLGGMVEFKDQTELINFNGSVERIEEAINLYQEGLIGQIILSGGSGSLLDPDHLESLVLKDFILARGVKKRDLILDHKSRNTYQNAVESKKILDSLEISDQPILLITSAFHMKRAVRCFNKQGIENIPFPVDYKSDELDWSLGWIVPSANALVSWQLMIKEFAGTLMYRITGYA